MGADRAGTIRDRRDDKKTVDTECNVMVDMESDEWEDGRAHLLEVLEGCISALDSLWRLAEPLLARSGTRSILQNSSWSYYQVFDGLKHSVEWLKAMPTRASDGTHVWEPEPAVTNEAEVPDGVGLEGREPNPDRVGDGRGYGHQVRDEASPEGRGEVYVAPRGGTLSRRSTPEEEAQAAARQEQRRLAHLRKPRATKRYPVRKK